MWNRENMKVCKHGNAKALTALVVCILAYFHTSTFAYSFSVCAVGDSITEGGSAFVAHRVALESRFAELGWDVEWKGSHKKTESGSSNLCEGWSGQNAVTIADKYEANAVGDRADVLLLHAGHNYNGGDPSLTPTPISVEAIVTAVTNAHRRIIAAARAQNPDVIVLYAKVITSGGNRAVKYSYIPALNEAIAANAAAFDTPESPVICVDMAEGWNYATDCVSDCVHPNASGAAKMAEKWMAAFTSLAAAGKLPGYSLSDGVWVDERAARPGITGSWEEAARYGANGRAELGDNTFTPYNASMGNVVTVEFTAQFCAVEDSGTDCTDAQAAVRLGPNGAFQIYSNTGWVDVEAEGVTPVGGAEYTLRTTFDYTKGTYSVEVKTGLTEFTSFEEKGKTAFSLAASASRVSSVGFMGDTVFTSLLGRCVNVVKGIMIYLH